LDTLHEVLHGQSFIFCYITPSSSTKVNVTPNFTALQSESESESELLYDWRFTVNQFVLATSPLRLTTCNFIFQLNTCGYSPYVTSFLTTEWVWRLQLLLVLASAVILRSESRGTHDHILLSQIRDSPNLEGPYLYPPGTGFPFRRLLRLAGLQWKYSASLPQGARRYIPER
jgi:hypothetical protein